VKRAQHVAEVRSEELQPASLIAVSVSVRRETLRAQNSVRRGLTRMNFSSGRNTIAEVAAISAPSFTSSSLRPRRPPVEQGEREREGHEQRRDAERRVAVEAGADRDPGGQRGGPAPPPPVDEQRAHGGRSRQDRVRIVQARPRHPDDPLLACGQRRRGEAEVRSAQLPPRGVHRGDREKAGDRSGGLHRQEVERHLQHRDEERDPVELERLAAEVAREKDQELAAEQVERVRHLLGVVADGFCGVADSR
jgi:hypothetical protein